MAQDVYDIVITPTGGEPETIHAVAHRTDPGGPSVGDEVCVITLAAGGERRVPLAEYWIETPPA